MNLDKNICNNIITRCLESNSEQKIVESELLLGGNRSFFSPWRYASGCDDIIEKKIWKNYIAPPNTNPSTMKYAYKFSDLKNLIPENFYNYHGFDSRNSTVSAFRMPPGNFTIIHYDLFTNYKGNKDLVSRLWISLSIPCFGHLLWIENQIPYTMLEQGSAISISSIGNRLEDKLHIGANLGYEDRWYMTITGERYAAR